MMLLGYLDDPPASDHFLFLKTKNTPVPYISSRLFLKPHYFMFFCCVSAGIPEGIRIIFYSDRHDRYAPDHRGAACGSIIPWIEELYSLKVITMLTSNTLAGEGPVFIP